MENFSEHATRRARGKKPIPAVFCEGLGTLARPVRACSACAGDYEDPDRTAFTLDEHEQDFAVEGGGEGVNVEDANDDEFPAQEA